MRTVMKILFLNPHINAEHQLVTALQGIGAGVLIAATSEEGWHLLQLHGKTIDLAVIHREGIQGPEEGFQLIEKIKADPAQADLPLIISSSQWGDGEFAAHQGTPHGANAYLRWPFAEGELVQLITSLFGDALASGTKSEITALGSLPAASTPAPPSFGGVVLEDAEAIFHAPEVPSQLPEGELAFSLEAPDFLVAELEQAPPATVPPIAEPTLPVESGTGAFPTASASPPPAPSDQSSISLDALDLGPMDQSGSQEPILQISSTQAAPGEIPISYETVEPFVATEPVDEQELASEMPYLFSSKKTEAEKAESDANAALAFAQPVGDAVVPGGAAQSPDVETLKKYLLLREQDVAVLSTQLNAAQEQVRALENQLKAERGQNTELSRTIDDQKRKIDEFEKEKSLAIGNLQAEIDDLRFQVKAKTDKARVLDSQVREAAQEIERLKERVRSDIRKIRVREKELENRLEIVRKDSEALITARENKIIELKRKIDILEFNMDLLQDQYSREKETSSKLRERLAKAAQVVRVAGGLLDSTASGAVPDAADPEEKAS